MVANIVESRRPQVEQGRTYATALESLLRMLVDSLEQDGQDGAPVAADQLPGDASRILCTVELNGACYTLIRHQAEPTASVLTPRELAIVRLIAQGLPNKCIGDILEISQWTVATHLRRVFMKLGVNSRAALVARLGTDRLLGALGDA